jgi:D-methionine transport system ATP-binding protein
MHVIYSICQKVAILDNSHIVEQGSVEKVFKSPQSEIARRLLRFRKLEVSNNEY